MSAVNPKLAAFERRVRWWQKKLGLVDWEIAVEWMPDDSARADVSYVLKGMLATARLSKSTPASEIDRSALHECLHLVLAPMIAAAEVDPHHLNEIYRESTEHAVIQVIGNALLGDTL
jgi:hypothetical protein